MSEPRIFAGTPYATDLNYGRACNEFVSLLPEGSWACLMDHDVMFTTPDWYRILQRVAAAEPGALLGAVTNRCAAPWQKAREAPTDNHDIVRHRLIGQARRDNYRTLLDVTDTMGMAGAVLCFSKATWQEVGGFADGLLCVDHQFLYGVREVGRRAYLVEGLYVYHWRRAMGDGINQDDYPKALDRRTGGECRCRGPERAPSRRVELPC